jgi:TonB family protein
MMAASVEREMWSRARWWLAIIFVLVFQIGLVFWLSDRSPIVPRQAADSPAVYLAEDSLAKWPTLPDPLLFSPANPHGFSGPLWLSTPKLEYHLSDWTVPPSLLTLQVQSLGNAFSKFVQTNTAPTFATADNPKPHVASPELFLPDMPVATQSILRIEGELAPRAMVTAVALPSRPHTNILANSVVQVVVDLDGNTVSASLFSPSGSEDADKQALELAKAARYQPIRGSGTGQSPAATLNWGRLVFEWHTVPLPTNNLTPQKP